MQQTVTPTTVTGAEVFKRGDRAATGASGGKHEARLLSSCHPACLLFMKTFNDRRGYSLALFLLSIEEGVTDYRVDSLEVRTIKCVSCLEY
jgi:hypothetical protein